MNAVELSPAPFPEAQALLLAPPGSPDCRDLTCYRDGSCVVSCWPLPWRARLAVLLGGRVWLHVLARTHPPVSLTVSRGGPFERPQEPQKPQGAYP